VNTYHIPKLSHKLKVDASWRKSNWIEVPILHINQIAGTKPSHIPDVKAKLAYDADAIYGIFQVQDRFVCARSENYQDQVCKDSCVEFFFYPGPETSQGYFNFEVNCGGTALFHYQKGRGVDDIPISEVHFKQVQIAHSMPKIVNPEINNSITWVVEFRLPFKILAYYTQLDKTSKGAVWRANFFKCADESSHPHWLTWSRIDTPLPNFHRPEYFGRLIFE
jgi:hypothetical protein